MNQTEKMEMQIAEDVDGSAIVKIEGLEDGPAPDDDKMADGGSARSNDDHDDSDDDADAQRDEEEAQAAGRTEDEREAIRAARREERKLKKKLHREKARESNHLIESLKRQNTEMADRLAALEKRSAGADMARMEKAIEDANLRMQYAKVRMAEAADARNGQALAEAQEQWYESRRQIEALEGMRKKATSQDTQNANVPKAPDIRMQRKAAAWMERNKWYDPEAKDTDSAVATKIDESLAEEGWDPTTDEYWDELDDRLTKYLPHRYNRSTETRRSSTRTPRSVQTGTGREASSTARPGEFGLSPERVRAIKEAGMWEDPKSRQKMIQKFVEYDRNQRGQS
jgi:hypothetical protein